jgi:hypothetical protein
MTVSFAGSCCHYNAAVIFPLEQQRTLPISKLGAAAAALWDCSTLACMVVTS